jgi:hypothetical protein
VEWTSAAHPAIKKIGASLAFFPVLTAEVRPKTAKEAAIRLERPVRIR